MFWLVLGIILTLAVPRRDINERQNKPVEQVNKALRYILYAASRAAGTQGESPVKGGWTSGGWSEQGQRRKAAMAKQRATNHIQA